MSSPAGFRVTDAFVMDSLVNHRALQSHCIGKWTKVLHIVVLTCLSLSVDNSAIIFIAWLMCWNERGIFKKVMK